VFEGGDEFFWLWSLLVKSTIFDLLLQESGSLFDLVGNGFIDAQVLGDELFGLFPQVGCILDEL